jgi:hypothetical protein
MVVVGLAAAYSGYTIYSRHADSERYEQQLAEKKAEEAKRTVELMGGDSLKILNFYASPPLVARGAKTQLCYGVANAKTVTLEPPVEHVWPAFTRCFEIAPKKSTTYTLTAQDAAGRKKTESVDVRVE